MIQLLRLAFRPPHCAVFIRSSAAFISRLCPAQLPRHASARLFAVILLVTESAPTLEEKKNKTTHYTQAELADSIAAKLAPNKAEHEPIYTMGRKKESTYFCL